MFSKFHKNRKGFTLVELMIIISIGLIVAVLAFQTHVRSKETESKILGAISTLEDIYSSQCGFHAEHGFYALNEAVADSLLTNSFLQLKIKLSQKAPYSYSMVADDTSFTCTASANFDKDEYMDVWTIDQTGKITHVWDDSVNEKIDGEPPQ